MGRFGRTIVYPEGGQEGTRSTPGSLPCAFLEQEVLLAP